MPELTTIPLKKNTRDALKMLGVKGESYDALIRRLIDEAKCQRFYHELDEDRLKGKYIKVEDIDEL